MPNRCTACGGIAGRARSLQVPGPWVSYLRSSRDLSAPVGTLTMPLCTDCYRDVRDLADDVDDREAWEPVLDDIALDALIDEGA